MWLKVFILGSTTFFTFCGYRLFKSCINHHWDELDTFIFGPLIAIGSLSVVAYLVLLIVTFCF